MPWLYPLDANGKPTSEHGLLDLAAVATGLVHVLEYNTEHAQELAIEIVLASEGAVIPTLISAERGVSGATGGYAAMASAVDFAAAGSKFGIDVEEVPRVRVRNVTPGSGAGKARVFVWARPLVS